jgi:hypothetical protein
MDEVVAGDPGGRFRRSSPKGRGKASNLERGDRPSSRPKARRWLEAQAQAGASQGDRSGPRLRRNKALDDHRDQAGLPSELSQGLRPYPKAGKRARSNSRPVIEASHGVDGPSEEEPSRP